MRFLGSCLCTSTVAWVLARSIERSRHQRRQKGRPTPTTMLAKLSLSHVTHLTWIVENSRSLRSFDTMSCQCQRSAHMATKCSNISKHSTLAGFQASISCISSGRSWMVNSGRRSLRFAINCSYSCPWDSEQIPTHLMSNLASSCKNLTPHPQSSISFCFFVVCNYVQISIMSISQSS